MTKENKELSKAIKAVLNTNRYNHTVGVAYTAAALAMKYEFNIDDAMTAGLLHDCAKGVPNADKLKMCYENNISVSEVEEKNPGLLHAKLGEHIARTKYHINNSNILSAIRYHTTGRPNMSRLEKLIFVADYIEPHREIAPNLDKIRMYAFTNIDLCIYYIVGDTLTYLNNNAIAIDTLTEDTYKYYKLKTGNNVKED
ncbi:MAG: bis(5'-nucleosyl)-tetraphosphatase (symmetrical) YqeK [Suipraeoptans sp.]